jgi:hypothetical protein
MEGDSPGPPDVASSSSRSPQSSPAEDRDAQDVDDDDVDDGGFRRLDHKLPRSLRGPLQQAWSASDVGPGEEDLFAESPPPPHSHFTQTFLQSILTSIESKDQGMDMLSKCNYHV